MCPVSHVRCQVSLVTCHVSHVMCKTSHEKRREKKEEKDLEKVVELVGGGSVIIGAYPVYFLLNLLYSPLPLTPSPYTFQIVLSSVTFYLSKAP